MSSLNPIISATNNFTDRLKALQPDKKTTTIALAGLAIAAVAAAVSIVAMSIFALPVGVAAVAGTAVAGLLTLSLKYKIDRDFNNENTTKSLPEVIPTLDETKSGANAESPEIQETSILELINFCYREKDDLEYFGMND